jgi:hypothetical protein
VSDNATLQALIDRQAITDLIYRYCRAVDRIDAELGYTVWHDDAAADYGPSIFQGSGRGFIDFVCEQHRRALTHTHHVSNIVIALDGDRAGSESYVTATARFAHGDQVKQITFWGRYVDQWSRRNGRWAIEKRTTIRDFDEIREATPASPGVSARDRTDPSYAVLGDGR